MLRTIVLLGLFSFGPAIAGSAAEIAPWLDGPRVSWSDHPTPSPDGRFLAFVVEKRPDQPLVSERILPNGMPAYATGTELRMVELATGRSRSVCPAKVSCIRPSWSPDGKRLAFYSDDGGKPGLWEYDPATSRRRRLAFGHVRASLFPGDEPKWSPDGKTLYFFERPAEIQKEIAASAVKTATSEGIRVFRSGPAFDKEPPPLRTQFAHPFRRDHAGSLVALDRAARKRRVIVPASATPAPAVARLSPSGKWISYLAVPHREKLDGEPQMDLAVVSASGKTTLLAAGLEMSQLDYYGLMYRWHPRLDELYYCREGKLWKVTFDGGRPRTQPFHPELPTAMGDPLLFDASGEFLVVGVRPHVLSLPFPLPAELALVPVEDGAAVRFLPLGAREEYRGALAASDRIAWGGDGVIFAATVIDSETQEQVVVGLDAATHRRRELWRGHGRFASMWRGVRIGGKYVTSYQDAGTPPDFFAYDGSFRKPTRLTSVDRRLAAITLPPARFVSTPVTLFDGSRRTVTSAVLPPPGAAAGEPPPAIVIGYPGRDQSVWGNYFAGGDPSATGALPVFLSRGYAVVLLDLPIGPPGKPGEPVQETVDVLLPQIDHLIREKLVDGERLAVMGQSYGGYFASAVLTRTRRFKAGIAVSGVFDLPSHYARLDENGVSAGLSWAEGGQGRMGGPLWKDPDRYLRNSPFFQAHEIETALLLIHGSKDSSYGEAKKMFMALRRLNRNAELVVYPGEGHVPRDWTLAHGKDAVEKMLAFLDRFLRK